MCFARALEVSRPWESHCLALPTLHRRETRVSASIKDVYAGGLYTHLHTTTTTVSKYKKFSRVAFSDPCSLILVRR